MSGDCGASKAALSMDAVHAVLWHLGDPVRGQKPDLFVSRLLVAFSAADSVERARLGLGFPELAMAFEKSLELWGFDYLRGLATAELDGSWRRSPDVSREMASQA